MGEIPMNYRNVVDAFSQDGSLYGSVFCDLGRNLSDEFYAVCKKAQSEILFAIAQDLGDLSVQDFGSYVMGMVEYIRESFSTCQLDTFAEAPNLIMLNYMNAMCSEGADSNLRSKVRDGFNTMFSVFPMEGLPEFCFCYQTVVDYINSFTRLICLHIDATYAIKSLIRTGDALYSNEVFNTVDGKGVAWYETKGPRSDIMNVLETVDDNYMSN